MDASVTSAIIAGVGVILTGWLGFVGTRRGTLATSEQSFRQTILQENERLRKRVDELEDQITTVKIENRKLKLEMLELKSSQPQVAEETQHEEVSIIPE